jgi:hypothetical protein
MRGQVIGFAETDHGEPSVALRQFLLEDIRLNGYAEVVCLTGQVCCTVPQQCSSSDCASSPSNFRIFSNMVLTPHVLRPEVASFLTQVLTESILEPPLFAGCNSALSRSGTMEERVPSKSNNQILSLCIVFIHSFQN